MQWESKEWHAIWIIHHSYCPSITFRLFDITVPQIHIVKSFLLMDRPVSAVKQWSTSTNWLSAVRGSTLPSSCSEFLSEFWFCRVRWLLPTLHFRPQLTPWSFNFSLLFFLKIPFSHHFCFQCNFHLSSSSCSHAKVKQFHCDKEQHQKNLLKLKLEKVIST